MMRKIHLLVVAMVVACGGAAEPADTPTSTSMTVVDPTSTTTLPATTTTLGPQQVLDAFLAKMLDPTLEAAADITMELSFAGLAFDATGEMEFRGANHQSVIEIPGLGRTETISVDGITYERSDDGLWISDERVPSLFAPETGDHGPPLDMVGLMETIENLEHQSTLVDDGETIHRLGLPAGTVVDPVAFDYPPGAPVEIDVVFWAKSDGDPHRFDILIEDASDPNGILTVDFQMAFKEPPGPIDLVAPEDAWLRHHSEDFGYTIAHPRGWEVNEYRGAEFPAGDFFYGLDGTELDVYRSDLEGEEEISLNAMVNEFRSLVTSDGMVAAEPEEFEIADLPARILVYGGEDGAGGQMLGIYAVSQVSPTALFEFILFSDGADPEGSRKLMLDFLSTFEVDD